MWRDAGTLDEFREEIPRVITIAGREIGVIRHGGSVYALRNVCPHQSGPLCRGLVRRTVGGGRQVGEPGEVGQPVISCAWHQWDFDLRTGRCVFDDTLRVKTYPVKIEGGRIFLDV
jgi:nitrite reductase/ring-hydroxylating ferredoxin subunit